MSYAHRIDADLSGDRSKLDAEGKPIQGTVGLTDYERELLAAILGRDPNIMNQYLRGTTIDVVDATGAESTIVIKFDYGACFQWLHSWLDQNNLNIVTASRIDVNKLLDVTGYIYYEFKIYDPSINFLPHDAYLFEGHDFSYENRGFSAFGLAAEVLVLAAVTLFMVRIGFSWIPTWVISGAVAFGLATVRRIKGDKLLNKLEEIHQDIHALHIDVLERLPEVGVYGVILDTLYDIKSSVSARLAIL